VLVRYLELDGIGPLRRIGLGTWQFGSWEWGYGEAYHSGEAHRLVRRAHELGVTLFDTAEMYGFGRSERILGEALAGVDRDSVVIATKIFPVLPVAPIVQQRAVASARRLGVQRIDLYQVHQPNPLIRDRTTMRGMRTLQDIGLVDEVGVSNYALARWRAAETALGGRVLSNQVHFSLLQRKPDHGNVAYAVAQDRIVIAYSPLEQGVLGGRYDAEHPPPGPARRNNPLCLPENLERATPVIEAIRRVAKTHDAPPAQVARAWLIAEPNVVAIPGASSVEQRERNVAAADLDLTESEVAELTAESDRFQPLSPPATGLALLRARRAPAA